MTRDAISPGIVNEGYCNWYELTKEIFKFLDWDVQITPIKSSELKMLARRPVFSALKNKKLDDLAWIENENLEGCFERLSG